MTRKFVLGKYLESVYLSNPFTLVPTDFQLYMKMKHKFYFRFSLLQNNEIGLPFPFCISAGNWEGNGITLSVFHFCNLKKRILIFFFVFRSLFS